MVVYFLFTTSHQEHSAMPITPTYWGAEFLLNTTTSFSQFEPSLSALPDGRFVAVWTDSSQSADDSSGSAVRAQMFNTDGSKSGTEFLVNTTTAGLQFQATLTALSDGRFVVAWTDTSQGDAGAVVRAQIFNTDSSMSGAEFEVNTTSADHLWPTLTALANGRFVAAWTDYSQSGIDTSNTAIFAQVFNADGSKSGLEFLVNTTTTSFQSTPTLTTLVDGRFVAAWTDFSQTNGDLSSFAIRAQIFNADGTSSGTEFLVNTTTAGDQLEPTLTALSDGRFVAAWADDSQPGEVNTSYAVRAQVFNTDGSKSGTEIIVSTATDGVQSAPTLTALAEGRFVATWTDFSQATSGTSPAAVSAQVFNSDGSKSGSEFLVNTTTTGSQTSSSITSLADGRFVVAWTDSSASEGDISGEAIRGQIFDPRESAISLSGSTLGDDFVGTQWADTMSGGLGEDQIKGADGDDWINGGAQNDTLWGDAGNDSLSGGAGDDTLIGGSGDDTYFLDSTNDVVTENVGGGNDTVVSAWISLELARFPQVENARLTGSTDLNLSGNVWANVLTGNAGANQIMGGGGDDTVYALAGNDTVFGGAGNDVLDGAAGNDTLNGGTGMDTLFGGVGKDRLVGGADADTFVFRTKAEAGNGVSRDVIVDFAVGVDKIDLSAIDANEGVAGDQAFSFIGSAVFSHTAGELRYGSAGGFLYADTNGDGIADFQLQLIGKPAIAGEDFML